MGGAFGFREVTRLIAEIGKALLLVQPEWLIDGRSNLFACQVFAKRIPA